MRRALTVVRLAVIAVAVIAVAAALPAAFAQDPHGQVPPADAPAAAPADTGPKTLRYHAVRYASDGNHQPLANRRVTVLTAGPAGTAPGALSATTDASGHFEITLAKDAAETTLEFLVPDEVATDRWPLLAAPQRTGGDEGGFLPFVDVEGGADPIELGTLTLVATVPDREHGLPSVRVNLFATIQNPGDRLWIGPRGDMRRGTFRLRIPAPFEIATARLDGVDVATDFDTATRELVLRQRIWPQEQLTLRVVLTAKHAAGAAYDFSFTADRNVGGVSLNLEEGQLTYEPSGWFELTDGGMNDEIRGRKTRIWHLGEVGPGDDVGVRFVAGTEVRTRVHPKTWRILAIFGLAVGGAFLLAKGIAGTLLTGTPSAGGGPGGADEASLKARIAALERRRLRGEITTFEFQARRQFLLNAGRPPAARKPARVPSSASEKTTVAGPLPVPAATPDDPRLAVERIAARVESADAATLRGDVRTLLDLLRRTDG